MQILFTLVMHSGIQGISQLVTQGCHRIKKEKGISNKRNIVKNPNWQEADRWLFTKCDRVFELGTTVCCGLASVQATLVSIYTVQDRRVFVSIKQVLFDRFICFRPCLREANFTSTYQLRHNMLFKNLEFLPF